MHPRVRALNFSVLRFLHFPKGDNHRSCLVSGLFCFVLFCCGAGLEPGPQCMFSKGSLLSPVSFQ